MNRYFAGSLLILHVLVPGQWHGLYSPTVQQRKRVGPVVGCVLSKQEFDFHRRRLGMFVLSYIWLRSICYLTSFTTHSSFCLIPSSYCFQRFFVASRLSL